MQVTSYHMHSMLESYGRKLSRMRRNDDAPPQTTRGEPALSAEGSRQATMDKISRQVLDKISDVVSLSRSRGRTPAEAVDTDALTGDDALELAARVGSGRTGGGGVGDAAAAVRRGAEQPVIKTDSWV